MTGPSLAAVVYEPGDGPAVDKLLSGLAQELAGRGLRLAGTVQRAAQRPDRCACDMIVTDLATGEDCSISEDRGPMARGCRLDSAVLEAVAGSTIAALEGGADLLIVNKFGKREAEGAGFRSALALALGEGVPALVAVNRAYIEAWRAFAGDFGRELPSEMDAIRAWCETAAPPGTMSSTVDVAPSPQPLEHGEIA